MPTFLDAPRAYLNFALQLRKFVNHPVSESELHQTIQQQFDCREENFLRNLKVNIYDYPKSPYLALLNNANLTFDDIKRRVIQQGLEATLEELYCENIYITFEEFKGRKPIIRNGVELAPNPHAFDTPNLTSVLAGTSGGSTGKPTHTQMDLDHIAQVSKHIGLGFSINNIFDSPMHMWWGLLPDDSGVVCALMRTHFGNNVRRWYTPYQRNQTNTGWYYYLLTYLMIYMGRFHGIRFPKPKHIPLDNPLPIAQALADDVQEFGSVSIISSTSKAVRVCICAQQHNISLEGVTFYGLGEPATPTKVNTIKKVGAKFITHYGASEAGTIGVQCTNPLDTTDVHLLTSNIALIQQPHTVHDQTVGAFYFTSLLPSSPKMLLNVQFDDFGIIEERDCGCPLHKMGFTKHLRQVGSISKLTGEGVTLIGSDMIHILEHDLPQKFGGSLLDYQLVEEENIDGLTKLVLVVDPSVPITDNQHIADTFLQVMQTSMPSIRLAQPEYKTGNVVTVRREKPYTTSRGKHLPIRTLKLNQ